MPIYQKARTSQDIINGLVVCGGGVGVPLKYDPSPQASGGGSIYSQHLASGDSLQHFQVLDGRFKTAPSGWSS
jgi:hypothetical protein